MTSSALTSAAHPLRVDVKDSNVDLRCRLAAALNVTENEVELEQSASDTRSVRCSGRVLRREFFAKVLLADPYPLNVVVPWKEAFSSSPEWRAAKEQIEFEWNRTLELRRTLIPSSIAQPLGRSLETTTLAWEKINGVPVLSLLLRGRVLDRSGMTAAAMFHAGAWLRTLHQKTAYDSELLDAKEILTFVLRVIQSQKPSTYVQQARAIVQEAIAKLGASRISSAIALNHGDFTLANLMWDEHTEQISVVDFENAMPNGIWQDLSTMALSLRKQLLNPLVSGNQIREMEKAFWAGYGEVSPDLLSFVYALAISRILVYYPNRVASRGERHGWIGAVTGSLYRSFLQGSMVSRSVQPWSMRAPIPSETER